MKIPISINKTLSVIIVSTASCFFSPAILGLGGSAIAAPVASAAAITAGLPDFAELVERTGPAVVNIRTTVKMKAGSATPSNDEQDMQEFFRRYFGIPIPQQPDRAPRNKQAPQPDEEVPRGVGSGFILSADGYVMTNAHVVDGADDVYVKLTDEREFKAKIIGSDKRTDVALLKIEGSNLPRLTIGDSDKIRVGEWVIAIGSPFDLDNTVTAGIISAKARDTGDYLPLIQTDVAVNPGNSGGPLINMRGEVIGINSQIYSRSGGYMGISFAVPIDEAMRISEQLKASGKVTRGRIGVQIGEVTKDVAESLGMSKAQGALVQRVEPDSPAEKGGLQAGDIILKYNSTAIERLSDLPRMVGSTKPGTRAVLTIWRKGVSRELALVITEMEPEKVAQKEDKKTKSDAVANALGLVVSDMTAAQKKELKVSSGVIVDSAEGSAARAGLRSGDLILQFNNTEVKDAKQFNALVAKAEQKKMVVLLVRRGDSSQFIPLKPSN